VVIGNGVESIVGEAFTSCNKLGSIELKGKTQPTIPSNSIPSTIEKIIVPIESLEAYKTATNWSYYADKIVAIVDTNHMPEVAMNLNLQNGEGACSIQQKGEADGKSAKATGFGATAFGGFRGDKPTGTPDPIPANDKNTLDIEDIDTTTLVEGIQSAAFGAGNRAYGNWNFIAGKDNKTFQKGTFAFGGKNLVGYYGANNNYLYSAAFGELNTVLGRSSFVAGTNNTISVYGENSLAVGNSNEIISPYSTTLGSGNIAYSNNTSAFGYRLKVGNSNARDGSLDGQTAVGLYNAERPETGNNSTLFMVGNGTATQRSNAFEVLKDGRAKVYSEPVENNDVVRKTELDAALARIKVLEDALKKFEWLVVN
jgi:hypothetical protein